MRRVKHIFCGVSIFILCIMTIEAQAGSVPNTFTSGSVARASDVNANFSYLADRMVPAGIIVMWSGDPVNVPAGWALCDGKNGTPDLSGRFVVGVGGDATIGGPYAWQQTGGEADHVLTVAEMPAHNHGGNTSGQSQSHTHPQTTYGTDDRNFGNNNPNGPAADSIWNPAQWGSTTGWADRDHTHAISTQGSNAPHNTRPPYYALAYIMKL
jgi:microcystin-dependent protein